ncbi:MAG: amidohydrolase [Bacteroidetes bacterium]|nr:amidohydrolase [Bacteroidota bacterium]
MSSLNISLIQSKLLWEDIEGNLGALGSRINDISEETDLIILPEMFNTGFTMNGEKLAEPMEGKTMDWMAQMASKKNSVITGSLIVTENDNLYNRLIWMAPDGGYKFYNKKHLFGLADEQTVYTEGAHRLIVELNGWHICPQICYDLRFPAWNRNQDDYDILLFVANWPEIRMNAWDALLKARAIENQAFVVAINRVGEDGNDYRYIGNSVVVDPMGKQLYLAENEEVTKTVTLDKQELEEIRNKLPFLKDRDNYTFEKR